MSERSVRNAGIPENGPTQRHLSVPEHRNANSHRSAFITCGTGVARSTNSASRLSALSGPRRGDSSVVQGPSHDPGVNQRRAHFVYARNPGIGRRPLDTHQASSGIPENRLWRSRPPSQGAGVPEHRSTGPNHQPWICRSTGILGSVPASGLAMVPPGTPEDKTLRVLDNFPACPVRRSSGILAGCG